LKESPIFVKTYDLLLWIQKHTGHYPKHERFRLAKRIDDCAYEFYDRLLVAVLGDEEEISLQEAKILQRKLVILFRISKDCGYMTMDQYLYISDKLNEIGKLISVWKKRVSASKKEAVL